MAGTSIFNEIMDWWLMLCLIYVLYALLLFIYRALTGWLSFLWLLLGLGLYPLLLAYVKIFQSPHVQLAYLVVVAVVLYLMYEEPYPALLFLMHFVIHSVLFIYVRFYRGLGFFELAILVVTIIEQLKEIVVKMVRSRSGSSLVEGASASSVTVEPEPALEMGVFSYRCHGEEQQEEECVICLSEYQEGVSLVALQRCQHNFHVECIRRWLNCMPRCPICNASTIQGLGSHVVLAGSMREGTIGREDNV